MAQAQIKENPVRADGTLELRDGTTVRWNRPNGRGIVPSGCFGLANSKTSLGAWAHVPPQGAAIFRRRKPL